MSTLYSATPQKIPIYAYHTDIYVHSFSRDFRLQF